jgi:t-SNARE complex subunit (syntaxin)
LIDSTNLAAADLRNKLKEMDQENKKMGNNAKGTAQYRIRTNMHGTLTRKFLDLMSEYQEVQTKYKNKYRERVERQYKIGNPNFGVILVSLLLAKPEATQEEIDEALESGNTQIFQKQILDMQHHAQAKEALIYIENRHRDIIRLEQSIKQLHQLFLDMAILVEAQGELIDQIEYNVSQSVAYTKQAVKELHTANKLQKRSRKVSCLSDYSDKRRKCVA